MEPQLLKVADVCRALSCCRSSVYKLVKAGELRPVKLLAGTRFRAEDIDAFVERFAKANTVGDEKGGAA